jgi:hypothetical protein
MNSPAPLPGALPDAKLTALIVRLQPKPGEPRVVAVDGNQLDLYMTPDSAEAWKEMLEHLEVLTTEHGMDTVLAIYDASMAAAHLRLGGVQ